MFQTGNYDVFRMIFKKVNVKTSIAEIVKNFTKKLHITNKM